MSKSLYLECASGISGDMGVAALLDLGADKNVLQKVLSSIPVTGFKTEITRVKKNGIDCCDFNVILETENHDHDMNYLFGENANTECAHHNHHDHSEDHVHKEEHLGNHIHEEEHKHHNHHEHRGIPEIYSIIDKTELTENARDLAKKIFLIIGEAESKAHGVPIEQVHFHEVGAVDSIVDVIAFAVCFDNLKINKVYIKSMHEGSGTIRCQHGILSIPVPAVANIVKQYELPITIGNEHGEFITPTGAAFAAAIITEKKLPESFVIEKIGLGAGKREYSLPSILRAFLIHEETQNDFDVIWKLETNIDDCTGEKLGFVIEELFSNGAKDVNYIPCFMKKNRPAYLLSVICTEEQIDTMHKIIFCNTTTIGIRRIKMERTKLKRQEVVVKTPWGEAKAKCVDLYGEKRFTPEYDDVKSICTNNKVSFDTVYDKVLELCKAYK